MGQKFWGVSSAGEGPEAALQEPFSLDSHLEDKQAEKKKKGQTV